MPELTAARAHDPDPLHFWGAGHVVFGMDSLRTLRSLAAGFSPSRVVVVADEHVIEHPSLQGALDDLASLCPVEVARHDGSEPSLGRAKQLAVAAGGDADLLVAVGGGSTIDIAKAVALAAAARDRPLESFEGAVHLDFDPAPLIAVPTTAGTGSEVTGSCVLEDEAASRKISIRSPKLVPRVAILDPALLASVPRRVIRATGIDALAHALEAYHSTRANVVTDRMALGAIARIARSIVAYYGNPQDRDAAASMQIAACMAGMAFNSARVGLAHAIASAIGPLTGLSHGECVGLGLRTAMRINLPSRTADRRDLLFHIGCETWQNEHWTSAVLSWLDDLYAALEFPATAADAGRRFDIDDAIVDNILRSGRLDTNPVRLDALQLRRILESIRG